MIPQILKKIGAFIKENSILLTILLLAVFLRTIYLAQVPPGLNYDELHAILNAQSIAKTGRLIPGMATGIIGSPTGDYLSGIFGEVGSYLLVPFVSLFGISTLAVKIPYILSHLCLILLVYLIVKRLTNRQIGLIAACLMAINPWSIHFARTAYESNFAFFFYFLSIYLLMNLKGWKIFWSVPFLLGGFLSYFATKVQLIPIGFLGILITKLFSPRKSLKPILYLTGFLVLFTIIYFVLLKAHPAGERIKELGSLTSASQVVNSKRLISLDSPINAIFVNKATENLRERVSAFLGGLAPAQIFWEGQKGDTEALTIPDHGFMYLVDGLFTILGLIYLSRKNLKALYISLGLVLISLLPNSVDLHGTTYALRSGLLYPSLVILAAAGIGSVLEAVKEEKARKMTQAGIALIYLVSLVNFAYLYFLRTPVEKFDGWYTSERVLARYINLHNENYTEEPLIVITPLLKDASYEYLYYSGKYDSKAEIIAANNSLATKNYKFDNVLFTESCNYVKDQGTIIKDVRSKDCNLKTDLTIASPEDAGTRYLIQNDKVCKKFPKKKYPLMKKFDDLITERKSEEDFCKFWVTNPNLD
jgi:4-amino-4-deoxy-L-arabinose transferase-like glycosyltransferase